MIVDVAADLASTKSKSQRPGSHVEAKSLSYHFETPNQNWPSSNSNDQVLKVKSNEQNGELSSRVVDGGQVLAVEQAGLDIFDENTKGSKLSSRLPPQPLYPDRDRSDQSTQSLGKRRDFAPRHLPCPAQATDDVSHAMVVSMSPSYTSVKDITPSSPLSPKSVSDSVKVSIPFQVHGQQQSSRPEQQSHVWSSSVSVCVPFQVNEDGACVSVLPSFDNQLLSTSLLDKQTTEQVARATSVPFLQEPLDSLNSNSVSVTESPTMERNTENAYSSATNKMSSSQPSFPIKSSSFLSPDDGKGVSQDTTDGGPSTKPRSHSTPTTDKRKLLKGRYCKGPIPIFLYTCCGLNLSLF